MRNYCSEGSREKDVLVCKLRPIYIEFEVPRVMTEKYYLLRM
jgi:hypothetical protein